MHATAGSAALTLLVLTTITVNGLLYAGVLSCAFGIYLSTTVWLALR